MQRAFLILYKIAIIYFTGIYLTCTMGITTLSMVLTVLVLNLHNIKDYPVPEWAYNVFLNYVPRYETPIND